jgi:aminoglycoside 3-N-acetyltransferase
VERIDEDQALPWTVATLAADLAALGVRPGSTLVVHSSLSSIGYVTGGAHAVVLALVEALGPDATLVVPTHSGELSDPGRWQHPPVPEAWWATIRTSMPAFDPDLTGTRAMGAVPDTVRHLPGAVRSAHPAYSFSAVGPNADAITAGHQLADGFGETSPLARLYDLDADILLLGVGHDCDTSLHLAEHRSGTCGTTRQAAPVLIDGVRHWVEYDELEFDTDDFVEVGAAAAAAGLERTGAVGAAAARLLSQPALVDFASAWFAEHRG